MTPQAPRTKGVTDEIRGPRAVRMAAPCWRLRRRRTFPKAANLAADPALTRSDMTGPAALPRRNG